ncbi:hypothetical protein [Aporhodopirellula aestuarii]|uniref:Uncharacterized protein n=1 Tax=Aporhodopirellula aestuarii TaxID=2950107 RepID=A0ABT0U5L2_9BACT|nr:hypothetical protein [Aporhodopirellula aestuarii]MCM2371636.1 hypothetical protein [Aporhodopirellula aestuarii]
MTENPYAAPQASAEQMVPSRNGPTYCVTHVGFGAIATACSAWVLLGVGNIIGPPNGILDDTYQAVSPSILTYGALAGIGLGVAAAMLLTRASLVTSLAISLLCHSIGAATGVVGSIASRYWWSGLATYPVGAIASLGIAGLYLWLRRRAIGDVGQSKICADD